MEVWGKKEKRKKLFNKKGLDDRLILVNLVYTFSFRASVLL